MSVKYLLDTCVFNYLSKGIISLNDLPSNGVFYVLHAQRVEIEQYQPSDSAEKKRQDQMLARLKEHPVFPSPVFMFGVEGAGFDEAEWADSETIGLFERLYEKVKRKDNQQKQKLVERNAWYDAQIGVAALNNSYILITADKKLKEAVEHEHGSVLFLSKPKQ